VSARAGDVLVDSSGWIQLLRQKGDADIRDRLKRLIVTDRAVWCNVVQLELWRGTGSDSDRKLLRELQAEIRSLEISAEVWQHSFLIAGKCRPKGIIVPTTDLIIYACARTHGVELFHRDKHFDLLANFGLV
jgi:predicted nucleic acid-binding protein